MGLPFSQTDVNEVIHENLHQKCHHRRINLALAIFLLDETSLRFKTIIPSFVIIIAIIDDKGCSLQD